MTATPWYNPTPPVEPTPSMRQAVGALDLVCPGHAEEYWPDRPNRRSYLSPRRLLEMDKQALAWELFQVFEAYPELTALEIVDPTEDGMSTLAQARLRAYFTDHRPGSMDHPGALRLEQRLQVFAEHPVRVSEQWEEASPLKRSHLEATVAAMGGRKWWAKCRQLRLELALEEREEASPPRPRL